MGERAAARFLRREGYTILERNVRLRLGEIDIVARDGNTLCIVEVKRRLSPRRGSPEEGITAEKLRRLRRLVLLYRRIRRLPDGPVRIDMVAIDDRGNRRSIRLHRDIG